VLRLPLILILLAALISVFFGLRYLLARQFMPYHAVVAGRPWTDLDSGVRTVILGMQRILGGGFIAYGVALLWLLLPMSFRAPWASWAVLTITLPATLPALYVTIALRRAAPSARTPVVPAAVVVALALIGAALSFLTSR
jgi:hypothetical protein